MLLVIPEAYLLMIDDLLHRRPRGTSTQVSEVDLSGISEMGNILSSCFINAMADAARLTSPPRCPEISIDMCLPVIDSVLARFNQPGDKLLLTEAVIYGGGLENVVCHQVLFLEPASTAQASRRPGRSLPRQADMEGTTVTVKMAEMDVVTDGRSLKTILGSCVGVILRDPDKRGERARACHAPRETPRRRGNREVCGLGHARAPGAPRSSGGRHGALQALLIGGAQMFPMGNAASPPSGTRT